MAGGIATAIIAATAALAGSFVGAAGSVLVARIDRQWKEEDYQNKRRDERKDAYIQAINLLTDWQWSAVYLTPDADRKFTINFVQTGNRVRIYGSPVSRAAVDKIQLGLAHLNDAKAAHDRNAIAAADGEINGGLDDLVEAASEDVGPRTQDNLRQVKYIRGAGPRT